MSSGAAAHASEIRKHNSNDAKCGELGWVCIPLVVETYGAWGQEAVKSFAQLASRLPIACSKPKSVIINDLRPSLVGWCPHEFAFVCYLCISVMYLCLYFFMFN